MGVWVSEENLVKTVAAREGYDPEKFWEMFQRGMGDPTMLTVASGQKAILEHKLYEPPILGPHSGHKIMAWVKLGRDRGFYRSFVLRDGTMKVIDSAHLDPHQVCDTLAIRADVDCRRTPLDRLEFSLYQESDEGQVVQVVDHQISMEFLREPDPDFVPEDEKTKIYEFPSDKYVPGRAWVDRGQSLGGLSLYDPRGWWSAHVTENGLVSIRHADAVPLTINGEIIQYGERNRLLALLPGGCDGPDTVDDAELGYVDLDDLINRLTELRGKARKHFGEGWKRGE